MIRLAADEDFNNLILRGLRRRLSGVDVVRVQDAGLSAVSDETVLEWAASENRVLLTHDARTMLDSVHVRLRAGMTMPGVFVLPQWVAIGAAIDDLVLILSCSDQEEWRNMVVHFPLK